MWKNHACKQRHFWQVTTSRCAIFQTTTSRLKVLLTVFLGAPTFDAERCFGTQSSRCRKHICSSFSLWVTIVVQNHGEARLVAGLTMAGVVVVERTTGAQTSGRSEAWTIIGIRITTGVRSTTTGIGVEVLHEHATVTLHIGATAAYHTDGPEAAPHGSVVVAAWTLTAGMRDIRGEMLPRRVSEVGRLT